MSKKNKVPYERHIDSMFPDGIVDEALIYLYTQYQPVGSGPLGPMKMVCVMIEEIAKTRGIELPAAKGTGFKE